VISIFEVKSILKSSGEKQPGKEGNHD
jgi:hypothetical protein